LIAETCPPTYLKAPAEVESYELSWVDDLDEGDSISTSTWIADDSDITVVSSSNTAITTTVRVSGGTNGRIHEILNHATTAGGRQLVAPITLIIEEK
jgi:hypothetical protein